MGDATRQFDFYCYGCSLSYDDTPSKFRCRYCGEPVSLRSLGAFRDKTLSRRPESLWAYADLLPISAHEHIVSLGEGATPLIDGFGLSEKLRVRQVLLKNETANPTGSFKDRQISVGISHAKEIGAKTVAVVSSGNVACAASAYAARAGMRAVLMMHGHASPSKIAQAAAYGGIPVQVETPSASEVFDLCREACARFGWYHLSTAGMYEPYNVEGAKTIAYELYYQTGGEMPDWIVAPVGGGGLLGGIWRGLLDLQRLGLLRTMPRLAGAQAAGCAPLKAAVDSGASFLESLKTPWLNPKTIAGGIADDILFDGHTVLPAIRTTNGAAIAVTDDEIVDAELMLASTEGILCEPSSAAAIAALKHLPNTDGNTTICCVVTGSGIKDLQAIAHRVSPPRRIPASLTALADAIGEKP